MLPMKAANKGVQTPAESPEGRASTKGNSRDQSTYRTQGRESVSQAVERIRQTATRNPGEKLTTLLHHITTDALRRAFCGLKQTASAGVDGLLWKEYEDGLEERLLDLHGRVHSGAYRALPSRRVAIPKPDGGTRPLGIAALEDKIVSQAPENFTASLNRPRGGRRRYAAPATSAPASRSAGGTRRGPSRTSATRGCTATSFSTSTSAWRRWPGDGRGKPPSAMHGPAAACGRTSSPIRAWRCASTR